MHVLRTAIHILQYRNFGSRLLNNISTISNRFEPVVRRQTVKSSNRSSKYTFLDLYHVYHSRCVVLPISINMPEYFMMLYWRHFADCWNRLFGFWVRKASNQYRCETATYISLFIDRINVILVTGQRRSHFKNNIRVNNYIIIIY